jgi:chromosome segregation ATPase
MLIDRAHLLDTLSVVRDRVSVMTDECNRQQCELAESTSTEVKLRASISELTDAKLGVEQQLQEAEQRAQREAAAAQQSFAELRERFDQLTADSEVARSQFGSQIGELQREISGLQLELFEAQQGAAEEEERHELQMEQIKREAIEEAAMMGAAETDNLRCRLAEFEEENGKLLDSEQELQNQVATLRRQLSDSQAYLDDFTKDRELIDEQQKAAADVAGMVLVYICHFLR